MSDRYPNESFNTIEEALDAIDFNKISQAMHILGWTYCLEAESPTPERLKGTVKELYENSLQNMYREADHEHGETSSGGFTVSVTRYDETPDMICVLFSIGGGVTIKEAPVGSGRL